MCSTHAHSLLNASSPTATTSTATSKAVRTHAWTHFSHASSVATPATTSVLLLQQRLKKRAALGRHQGSAQAVVACGSVHLKCAVCCVLCAVCCVLCAVCCVLCADDQSSPPQVPPPAPPAPAPPPLSPQREVTKCCCVALASLCDT
jgi:hypothetical protein